MAGTGSLTLTGQLGDVMKESARAALSWLRTHAREYGIDPDFFKNAEMHVHVPSGAIPKDGPSAGVTMATAMASVLTGRPVRGDVAMTGEITLSGRVLPVGGIKEKVLAARRVGIREVILPKQNAKNVNEDLTPELRQDLTVHLVSTIDEVLALALQPVSSDAHPRGRQSRRSRSRARRLSPGTEWRSRSSTQPGIASISGRTFSHPEVPARSRSTDRHPGERRAGALLHRARAGDVGRARAGSHRGISRQASCRDALRRGDRRTRAAVVGRPWSKASASWSAEPFRPPCTPAAFEV